MTTVVSRHFAAPGATEEEWAESLGEDLADDIDKLERRPHALGRVFNNALLHLGARCTVDPRAAKLETWEAVVNALQVGSAIFATASATEGTVECRINRQIRMLDASVRGSTAHRLPLAVVCQDQDQLAGSRRFRTGDPGVAHEARKEQ
ncbi:hypothetical protein GCM10010347_63970 [Streptomyces cirratus]|uniref:Uncharacterized protein n=1 Tax=Streptomyces cirratus TaxID=68187 RepID=A0ABQ3F4Q1_9ACTN|nr:Imm49 family immunity protein [Streptomyces cirratus]GHB84268.1 hypothetical protein GCM10010347_63970 [Streptomyces cirratus]